MSYLKKYAKKYWKLFCFAVSCLMMEALCDLMQPTIMSKIIDTGVAGKDMGYVLKMGGIMLGVTAMGAVAAAGRNILASLVSQRFGTELRSDLFKKIQTFTFENVDRFETSSLVTRLTNDVTQVQTFLNGTMRIFVKAPLVGLGSIVMATLLYPRMALVLLAVVPIVTALIIISVRTGYPRFRKVQSVLDRINGVMREYLSGVRVVKAFNRFEYETSRFAGVNDELADANSRAMRVMAMFLPGITFTVNLGIVAVIWLGGVWVDGGGIQVGKVIAFINYMTQVLFALMTVTNVFMTFVRARASAERIGEVMEKENSTDTGAVTGKLSDKRGSVEFEHVHFSYSGASGEPVLKDITFSCNAGDTVGIIGSTGSGKSSLVNLIGKFYGATYGSVKVNGVDVKDTDPKELREKIAYVPQKTVLFTGTIMENLQWGNENAVMNDMEVACRIAQAHGFINSFPEGYGTLLGRGGVNLSGGQKQRISIARALLRKPEILIMDDSTSAVDMSTEARIREGMRKYSQGMTCFIIAQRITSVMNSDTIIVMDNGEITGIGKHDELMESCEVYRDIFRSQIGRDDSAFTQPTSQTAHAGQNKNSFSL